MDTIISVRNLRKVYAVGSERVVALNDINLEIGRGQICCVLGTSGSGKSTLLNQLAGLEKPTKGCVYIGKHNISTFSENQLAKFRQRNIGFIFQSYNLMTSNTALENVAMPLMFRGVGLRERNKRAMQMLKEVGLAERAHHRPSQMSGGQQQRVGIARAFVAKPKIVFADEPTGNLDTKTTLEVMEMMVRISRENNQTFILVTHDQYLAQYADRIITLIDGKIVSDVENVSIVDRMNAEEIKAQYMAEKEQTGVKAAEHGKTDGKHVPSEVLSHQPDTGQKDATPKEEPLPADQTEVPTEPVIDDVASQPTSEQTDSPV